MSGEIVEYSQTEAALVELREKYARPFDVKTLAGMAEARAARSAVKKYRTSLEAMRKELKEPALRRCQQIDNEAKRITAALIAIEDPIDAAIKTEERREEEEKAAAERARQARADVCSRAESALRTALFDLAMKSSADIAKQINRVHKTTWPEEVTEVRDEVLAQMELHRVRTVEREADDARRDAERAELAALRTEAERQERERVAKAGAEAKAERDRIAEEARAAAEKIADAMAAQTAERERLDREAAAARAEEDQRVAAERAKIEAERKFEDDRKRKLRDAEEAKAKAADDRRIRKLDARAMLAEFVRRYGELQEFAGIVSAIRALTLGNSVRESVAEKSGDLTGEPTAALHSVEQ